MIEIVAHRGGGGEAPENTLAAFNNAADFGINTFELDVHLTADGRVVCIHDDTVERTTGARGRVSEMTWEQLALLDARADFHHDWPGPVRIPLLEEVLGNFPDKRFYIEIKKQPSPERLRELCSRTCRLINKTGSTQRSTIISFEMKALSHIRKFLPELKLGFLALRAGDSSMEHLVAEGITMLGADLIAAGAHEIQHAREHGMLINLWTANNTRDFRKCLHLRADSVTTDFPVSALKFFQEEQYSTAGG